MKSTSGRFLNASEVARIYGASPSRVYQIADKLGAIRFGRSIRFPEAAIREFERQGVARALAQQAPNA
jgi:predicted DNA-binding transcriptional regulator AlpA